MPPSSPELIGHTTVQHVDNLNFVNKPEPPSTPAPLPTEDLSEDDGTSDSDDESLPFLGDPEHEFFTDITLPSNSLIGAAAFKWVIDAGEEVYTINIQLTSDYPYLEAL